jgi:hypothetical protein
LKRRCSFGDDPSLLEGVDKWRTTATAKLVQRLWINPHFGEDNERSEVGSPEMGKSTFWGRHYERSESWQSR